MTSLFQVNVPRAEMGCVLFVSIASSEVAAMVIARIECKPERLCVGDEFQEVGYVVQKGLRARRHHLKDMLAKLEHPFVRVLGGLT
jgi:hypothetical protein